MGRYDADVQTALGVEPTRRSITVRQGDDVTRAAWRDEQARLGARLEASLTWPNLARTAGVYDPFQLAQSADTPLVAPRDQTWKLGAPGATVSVPVPVGAVLEARVVDASGRATEPLRYAGGAEGPRDTGLGPVQFAETGTGDAHAYTAAPPDVATRVAWRVALRPWRARALRVKGFTGLEAGRRLPVGELEVRS